MRNDYTDLLGTKLNRAYKRSGLSVEGFVTYLITNHEVEIDKVATGYSFFKVLDNSLIQFYFDANSDTWQCKI